MVRKLQIKNGRVFRNDGSFAEETVYCAGERLVSARSYAQIEGTEEILDAEGKYILPGLVDLHFHGCMGSDCCDGSEEAFKTICRYELSQGVTAVTPATMTVSEDTLAEICRAVRGFSCEDGADLCGLYMEGPFISHAKKGAQNALYIRPADTALLDKLQELSGGKILSVVVAPETENALEFIRANKDRINISIAHTTADYDTSVRALENGARQLTHMFNAMPGLGHRAPGPIGAAADSDHCMVEMICDGVHLHPSTVRIAFRIFGDDRIILISDSMRACGMQDGTYDLGGQEVTVSGNLAVLADGTIAGSVTSLYGCLKTAVLKMGIPLGSAVKCASLNPARALGIDSDHGSLEPGHLANLLLVDRDLNLSSILHRGRRV